ncbi:MAG: Ala-tRNA(Pro) hydrolase, partial [Rhodospirillaceae bacterium TMED167]
DQLNRLITDNHPVVISSISDADLVANPDLVRTMSVQPPTGAGQVRLISIGGVDLQPCGGTHVKATGEIGLVRVGKIENKGKHNRRINVYLEE